MTLFADLVAVSGRIAATRKRSEKIAMLAGLLAEVDPDEIVVCVAALSGEPRQGRIGIGWAAVRELEAGAAQPALTISEVDAAITVLAAATGPGSSARRAELLGGLLARATADEGAFLTRLLTGQLRQGALAGLMADAVAKASGVPGPVVRRALMLSGDLPGTAALALSEGEVALAAVGLELMRPVQPMLASTAASVTEAVTALAPGPADPDAPDQDPAPVASVEWKLDGIRIQVHRRGDEVRVYTRNLNEITASLPGVVASVRALPLDSAVLDGEALWITDDGPAAFQDTVSRIDADAPPEGITTFLFDVLHLDGEDLLDTPLRERAARLQRVAPALRVPSLLTTDPDAAEQVLADALAAGHEGVVVKDASSLYVAGRRGSAWRKVKPVRTYDLVVLGAEWGHGRRTGRLSNLHLGARDPDTGAFVMVGKTFKGLTDELLAWQTDALLERETERRGITVFVRPELVVEIAIDGVQSSRRYPGGVALRFARVKGYRADKRPAEADTIDGLRALLARRDLNET